jgi:hypothetical protein
MGNETIQMREGFCYPKSGWYDTAEAETEAEGREGSMFMYHCGPIRALTRWYKMSGDEKALETARKLVTYVTHNKFWGSEYGWPKTVVKTKGWPHAVMAYKIVGHDRAQFTGHFHGHTAMLLALIEYANATNDKHLKEFVRSGYEYARNLGIARIGLIGETCTISDMIATAIKLTEGGVGEYWDDVDGYIRNQLIEQQLTNVAQLKKVSDAADPVGDRPSVFTDNVIERTAGVFCGSADLGQCPNPYSIQCCTGNGSQGLYYAWEGIIRRGPQESVRVNLLLNRSSPWMDIESYLPYEGKVILRNKTAQTLYLRIPNWVDRSQVSCRVGNRTPENVWVGNYLIADELESQQNVTVTFPMEEETVTYTVVTNQQWASDPREDKNPDASSITYTCRFRGNTLVDFTPRPDDRWYLNYQRQHYNQDQAPLKETARFASSELIQW